ncbi:IS3 family transposase [Thermaerobacillus caldiproteolyticus]|uniref:IS3 family transposase n=1 Tax=Thermaerobacillus caldiproteolyticus TaxID=247480 RepID=UPI0035A94A23
MITIVWSCFRKSAFNVNRFHTRKEMKQAVFEYIECFYNHKRSNSALGYVLPCEFEAVYYAKQRKAAA